jgi:ribose 5-phosphate isomerase B
MKLVVAADHGGRAAKESLRAELEARGYEVLDEGTHDDVSCDYPDYAARVAARVAAGEARFGVLVCGTGIGMAVSANKHKGVRAAVVADAFSAAMCRAHNDANVICFGARLLADAAMLRLLLIFLETDFEGGRHARRVAKMGRLELEL